MVHLFFCNSYYPVVQFNSNKLKLLQLCVISTKQKVKKFSVDFKISNKVIEILLVHRLTHDICFIYDYA